MIKVFIAFLILLPQMLIAQTKIPGHKNKIFTIGIVPGISSSGLKPRLIIDQASIHLFTGYSAATEGFGFSLIQNLNTTFSKGLFIAGISNITGVNNNENNKEGENNIESNLEGVQISGILNLVLENTFGGQLSGFFNITHGGFFGLQLAGVANVVSKYSFGTQIGGILNISRHSFSGAQVAGLLNYTAGRAEGLQLGSFNYAEIIHGKNSDVKGATAGLQIGLANRSYQMDGFQIGLINIGKKMRGTQIGLINIAGGGKTILTRDGTTIGLLNFGTSVYSQIYLDSDLSINYEIGTGMSKNSRMQEKKNKYFFSSLTYSKGPALQLREHWKMGFGLFKLWAPRSISMGEYYISSGGLQVLHYNSGKKFNEKIIPLIRLRYMYGRRINKKLGSIYGFVAVTANLLFSKPGVIAIEDQFISFVNKSATMWPGLQIGLMTK